MSLRFFVYCGTHGNLWTNPKGCWGKRKGCLTMCNAGRHISPDEMWYEGGTDE